MKDLSKATVQSMPRKNRLPKPISVGVTAALAVVNGITSNGGVGVSKNILYGDKPLQDLDIYYPKPLAKAMQSKKATADNLINHSYPMVVFVHGGSWESGNKDEYACLCQTLANKGVFIFTAAFPRAAMDENHHRIAVVNSVISSRFF